MNVINLTQHAATPSQTSAGIWDVAPWKLQALKEFLTFPADYTSELLNARADALVTLAKEDAFTRAYSKAESHFSADRVTQEEAEGFLDLTVMIGGMPSFMPVLQEKLISAGFKVGYARTDRVSVDKVVDGKVVKTAVFDHVGMFWAN